MPASAFGPYAAAAQAQVEMWPQAPSPAQAQAGSNVAPYPGPPQRRPVEPRTLPTDEVVADLQAHRQRVEAQSEVSLRTAIASTVEAGTPAPDVIAMPPLPAEPLRPAPMETMKVEAVERTVTFHVPAGEAAMPASLRSMLAATRLPVSPAPQLDARTLPPVQDLSAPPAEAVEPFEPWTALPHDETLNEIAGRFAPTTSRP